MVNNPCQIRLFLKNILLTYTTPIKKIIWLHHTDMHVITNSAKGADA